MARCKLAWSKSERALCMGVGGYEDGMLHYVRRNVWAGNVWVGSCGGLCLMATGSSMILLYHG